MHIKQTTDNCPKESKVVDDIKGLWFTSAVVLRQIRYWWGSIDHPVAPLQEF